MKNTKPKFPICEDQIRVALEILRLEDDNSTMRHSAKLLIKEFLDARSLKVNKVLK